MSDLKEVLEENSYLRQKQLIFADCDRYQRARVSTLLSIAAAVAGADYDARGLTYDKLYEMREVFLLSRVALRIHRDPRALQTVDVTTWEDGVKEYLAQYPDIQLILDVHRDGIQRDTTTIVKPATEIDGEPAAQIMILCGSDPGVGDWGENLRTAAAVTNLLESRYPTLTRPIYFSTGRYNMNLSGGTILLEFGSQANTLEEALTSARLTGQALGEWLQELAGNA